MAGMIEVAKATVTIVPNMQGSQKTITEELTGVAGSAGEKAGTAAGTNMAKSIGKAVAGTAVAAKVGKGLADSWKEVDSALDTVAVKTGATGDSLEDLGDSMKRVASSVPTDFAAAGDAIGEVNTKFQLTGEELEDLSTQFIKFAQINNTDVTKSVDTVANTMAAFGQDASTATDVLDAMTAAGQATGIGMDELGKALQKNAPQFVEMGMSVEDAAGMMATFNAAGLTTADTSTALRTAMKNAAKDGWTLEESIRAFGRTMNSDKVELDKLQAAIDLFGAKAGPAIYNAFKNGTISAEDFETAMGDVSGTVSETFEATLDPTDRFQQAMNGLKTIGAELVEGLMPALNVLADVLVPAISKVADVFNSLPTGVKTAIVAIGGIAAVAGPLSSLGGNIAGIFGKLAGIFSGIGGAASNAAGGLSTIASSAAGVAGPASSAASGLGSMAGGALQIVAVGASFALVGVGLKLIADGAVAIAQGGPEAGFAMLGLVAAVTAFMGVAALLGPMLTAGAVGIAAFGAAVLAIGGGIALATTGIAMMADALGRMFENVKSAGEGLNLIVDALKRMEGMNIAAAAADMIALGGGLKSLSKNAEDMTATATAANTLAEGLNGLVATAPSFETFANTITKAFQDVKTELIKLATAFQKTKLEFNTDIKLPHFKMSGKFDAQSGSVPSVGVSWYAQAAERGAIFSSPQLIGVGDSSQPEMLLGERTLYDNIREAVSQNNGDVYVYIGDQQLDAIIQRSNQRTKMRRGSVGGAY